METINFPGVMDRNLSFSSCWARDCTELIADAAAAAANKWKEE